MRKTVIHGARGAAVTYDDKLEFMTFCRKYADLEKVTFYNHLVTCKNCRAYIIKTQMYGE